MSKPFSIQDYKAKNQWKTGAVTKEVGDSTFKGGHNDVRKTKYDVNIVDGKLDLNTHKTIVTESVTINEAVKLSADEIKDIKDIVNSDIEPFMKKIGEYAGPDYFHAVKSNLISQINSIKAPKVKK